MVPGAVGNGRALALRDAKVTPIPWTAGEWDLRPTGPAGHRTEWGQHRRPGLGAMRAAGASSSRGTCRTVNFLPQLQRQRLESDGYPERPVDPCILAD